MTDKEVFEFIDALKQIIANKDEWEKDYIYNNKKNEFFHKEHPEGTFKTVKEWFKI